MGVRLRVHDGEPIGQALKRFNRLVDDHQRRHKRHKQVPWRLIRYPCYIKPSQTRSYKKRVKLLKAQLEEYRRTHRPEPVVIIFL
ncbi:MAG TPA: hypothetical protein VGE74_17390 [Gemmata sp.]